MAWSTDYGEKGSARNALRIAAITGLLAAPSAILLVPGLGSIYLALCVLPGVLIAVQQRRSLKALWKDNGAVRWVGVLLLTYLLVSLGNFALIDPSDFAFSRLQRQLILLAIPAVFVLLWWARPTILAIHAGIALNAVTFGVYAIASYLQDGQRVQAVTNWILFGNAGLLLGFSALGLFFLRPSWPWRTLGLAGLGPGCCRVTPILDARRMAGHSPVGGDQPGRAPQGLPAIPMALGRDRVGGNDVSGSVPEHRDRAGSDRAGRTRRGTHDRW
jgi:hypothetical protein